MILALFSFSSSERFLCLLFFTFFLFLLRKDFGTFHVLLFEAFLCVFNNTFLPFLCIYKKIYKNFFISYHSIFFFFIKIFFFKIFFIRIFFIKMSSSESEEIFILSIIYLGIFFLKQHIYILLKTLEDNNFYLF